MDGGGGGIENSSSKFNGENTIPVATIRLMSDKVSNGSSACLQNTK